MNLRVLLMHAGPESASLHPAMPLPSFHCSGVVSVRRVSTENMSSAVTTTISVPGVMGLSLNMSSHQSKI